MSIYIRVYQNKASPKNWLIPKLLTALCLSLPSTFIHLTIHCDSVIPTSIGTPTYSWVCVHLPTLVETVPVSQDQPWGHQPCSLWPPQEKGLSPLSPCRKWSISSLPLRYDRHGAYLQERSRFNKATSKYARCQLFVYRDSSAIWRHL